MKKLLAVCLIALSLGIAGCGNSNNATDDSGQESSKKEEVRFKGDYIVDADYVKDHLDDIILIDARG